MLLLQPEAERIRCADALDGTHGSQQVFSSVSLRIYNHRPGNETQTDPGPVQRMHCSSLGWVTADTRGVRKHEQGQFLLLLVVLTRDLQSLKSDFSQERGVMLSAFLLFLFRARNQSPERLQPESLKGTGCCFRANI